MPSKSSNSRTRREIFSNPFAMSQSDSKITRRQLDKFYDSDDDDDDDDFEEVHYDVEGGSRRRIPDEDGSGAYAPVATKGLLAQDVLRDDRYYGKDDTGAEEDMRGDPRNDSQYQQQQQHQQQGRRRQKARDQRLDEIITMPSSFNTIWIYALVLITAFGLAWYGLSKEESRNEKMQAALELEAAAKEDSVSVNGIVNFPEEEAAYVGLDENVESNGHGEENANAASKSIPINITENIKMDNNPNTTPARVRPPPPSTFDPFELFQSQKQQQQQINFHTNEWYGAPFVVSPPRLPDAHFGDDRGGSVNGRGSRLGYLQYPTIVNGTLVFSSEGDLYLTRLDDALGNGIIGGSSTKDMYAAMKLTTTVGNAIHPKLNPRYPHLLAYSATYSGTREVYLMDLRRVTLSTNDNRYDGGMGGSAAPGSPGGPALRLTYTPGGIRSVVGWSDDGMSILYSAMSTDVALPDVRLFRLRLTSGVGMEVGPVTVGNSDESDNDGRDDDGDGDGVEDMNATNQKNGGVVSTEDQSISNNVNDGGKEKHSAVPSGGENEVESSEPNLSSNSVDFADHGDRDDDDDDDDDDDSVDQVVDANESSSSSNFSDQEKVDNAGVTGDEIDEDDDDDDNNSATSSGNPSISEDKITADQEGDDDDDDDDATDPIADANAYVEKMAPEIPNPPRNDESGDEQAGGESNTNQNSDHNSRQRRLYREERQRRHLAKLASRSAYAKRGAMGSPESPIRPIIEPVPLAQSTEGVYHSTSTSLPSSKEPECMYFTRFKQSSSTKRYVGGTAESIWAYCPGEFDDMAIPLTDDYNGTSKSPSVYYNYDDFDLILFMSDRAFLSVDSDEASGDIVWTSGSMDLWAAKLPVKASGLVDTPIRLTSVSCEHNGLDLSEYSVDPISGAIILRIGADLYYLPKETIANKISRESNEKRKPDDSDPIQETQQLPIAVYSDFSNMQERLIPLSVANHLSTIDAYATSYGTISTLLTARGQTFVAPVIPDTKNIPQSPYGGGGRNMPARRYKVAPGSGGGGIVRILTAKHIPNPKKSSQDSGERHALVLATDPLSPTAEHAFYIVRTDAMASPAFGFASLYDYGDSVADTGLPTPFIGGHLESGGSTKERGLGSVYYSTVRVSPCGRRAVWTNTDGQIVSLTIPKDPLSEVNVVILPQQNEIGQPMVGDSETELVFSPGGRYLAITHPARNQFKVISIADLGVPEDGVINVGRIVQATTDRFNSFSPVWGKQSKDFLVDKVTATLDPSTSVTGATALFFLSDRDVVLSGPSSPWGTRAPSPSFSGEKNVYTLPLQSLKDSLNVNEVNAFIQAPYAGGGAMEVSMEGIKELDLILESMASSPAIVPIDGNQTVANSTTSTALLDQSDTSSENVVGMSDDEIINSTKASDVSDQFIIDAPISFGPEKDVDLSFARSSFRMDSIPSGDYVLIVSQLLDDPSLVVLSSTPNGFIVNIFAASDYPSDGIESVSVEGASLDFIELSTDGHYLITLFSTGLKVSSLTADGIAAFMQDASFDKNIANVEGLHLSIWPALEYEMMFKDAWRMLRDYFYDPSMAGLEWDRIFDRYLPLVERCAKREELDDVLRQMAGELSALHVFVYGGEYNVPNHGDPMLDAINEIASLGAILRRSIEKFGYEVIKIPEIDPDFHMVDGLPMYSPLSSRTLRMSGQDGLAPGDVIVGVNGESVMSVPDINILLRNVAGESVRLEVVRFNSTSKLQGARKMKARLLDNIQGGDTAENLVALPEPLIVVPVDSDGDSNLWYTAWEWKTRQTAKRLAADAGFTLGYIHLRDMVGAPAEDAFVRGFYPDYDKEALIVDVRNNHGGNIDSWLLDVLQKRAWMYWEGRSSNITNGGLGWDEQFAFRGHLVVIVNEHTSSDGEAFARGVSELGLGKIVGKRTWGGGIWLSSDNRLVDGGIATAPEIGVYNEHIGLGLKIENMGVVPDVEVDNNPRTAFDGVDTQLERAINVLKEWLAKEPIVLPLRGPYADLSLRRGVDDCSA